MFLLLVTVAKSQAQVKREFIFTGCSEPSGRTETILTMRTTQIRVPNLHAKAFLHSGSLNFREAVLINSILMLRKRLCPSLEAWSEFKRRAHSRRAVVLLK